MAETPEKRIFQSPGKSKKIPTNPYKKSYQSPLSTSLTPKTPQSQTPIRRSARHASRRLDLVDEKEPICVVDDPVKESTDVLNLVPNKGRPSRKPTVDHGDELGEKSTKIQNPRTLRKTKASGAEVASPSVYPLQSETKKRKRDEDNRRNAAAKSSVESLQLKSGAREEKKSNNRVVKKKVHYKKVIFDGIEFEIG